MKSVFLLAVIVATCFFCWIHATISLADSGYPMPGANPQRNYKVNRPIRCAEVSNGKTTVLDEIYSVPEVGANFLVMTNGREVTLDGNGWAYTIADYLGQLRIYRFNTTNGSYDDGEFYIPGPSQDPLITHLAEGIFYWSGDSTTNIVNASAFETILNYADDANYGSQSSMAPYKNDWMVKSRIEAELTGADAVMFFKDSTSSADTSITNIDADFVGTIPLDVMVYKSTTSTTEFPIVPAVATELGGPTKFLAPGYTVTLDNTNARKVMIVGEEVIITHFSSMNGVGGLYKFDAATGAMTMNKTYTSWNGQPFFLYSSLIYHNGKAFAQMSSNLTPFFVDLVSGQTVATPQNWVAVDRNFAFSTVDQTVLALGVAEKSRYFEITGFEWDTWKVNVRGRVPDTDGDTTFGTVVIDDNCRVHMGINHVIRTLAPLPIQNVIPILECVDRNTKIGYFTYNNTHAKGFTIPQVEDRNNLSPGNIAPIEVFRAGVGSRFPISAKVLLNESNSFTWTLENYVLSFTITSDLDCPESINILLILTGDSPFPIGFNEIVRDVFVNVTGISDSRVTLVAKKRSVEQQSTLETELEIGPDPSNQEPTAAQVVQDFQQQQIYDFNQQIESQEGAPANIDTQLGGKALPSAIQGEIPPEPVAPPTTPTTPTPVLSGPTSVAGTVQSFVVVFFIASLVLASC